MYYIIVNGMQQGPFSKEQLRMHGITPDSFVWRAGLNDWVKASQLPELSDLFFEDSAFGAYTQPDQQANQNPPYSNGSGNGQQPPYTGQGSYGNSNYGYNNYGQQPYGNGQPDYPPNYVNWLPWAIAGTVLGILFSCIGGIFGIIGIVNANKANSAYAQGMRQIGDAANSTARTVTIISLVFVAVGVIVSIIGISSNWFPILSKLN